MCFSPACRWVGWQRYIQCHPSQHRRSRPHTSPLASGSLAHMRWCTGFMEGGRDREDGGIKQWAKVENKVESRASKHKYLWVGKTNKTHDWNWKLDTEKLFLHIFTSLKKKKGEGSSLWQIKVSKIKGTRTLCSRTLHLSSFRRGRVRGNYPGALFRLAASNETRSNLCGGNFNYHLATLH